MKRIILFIIPLILLSCESKNSTNIESKNIKTSERMITLLKDNFNYKVNDQNLESYVDKLLKNPKPCIFIKGLNTNVYSFGFTGNDHYIILEDTKTNYLSLLLDSYSIVTFPEQIENSKLSVPSIVNHNIDGLNSYFNESLIKSLDNISINQIDSILRYALEVIDGIFFEVSSIKKLDLKDYPRAEKLYKDEYLKNYGSKYYSFVCDYLDYFKKEFFKNRTLIYFNESRKRIYFFVIGTPDKSKSLTINIKCEKDKRILKKQFFKIECYTFNSNGETDIRF
ncbi:MAG: hypothetical protein ACOYO1_07850 [Bacteroidales bacterium]